MADIVFNTTEEQRQAAIVKSAHDRRAEQLRGDLHLSDEGKLAHLAANYLEAKEKLDGLRDKETGRVTTRRDELQRHLFGVPSDATSILAYRDARDRADKLATAGAALAALEQAEMIGDTLMAQALALHAGTRGWGTVLSAYATAHAELRAPLDELTALVADGNSKPAALARNIAYGLSLPGELSAYRDRLPELAAQALGATATAATTTPVGTAGDTTTWSRFFGATA